MGRPPLPAFSDLALSSLLEARAVPPPPPHPLCYLYLGKAVAGKQGRSGPSEGQRWHLPLPALRSLITTKEAPNMPSAWDLPPLSPSPE